MSVALIQGWEDFQDRLYVKRAAVEAHLDQWASAPFVDQSIISIVSPPGTGKSWLMQAISQRWKREDPRRLSVWMSVPDLVSAPSTGTPGRTVDGTKLVERITEFYAQARAVCPEVRPTRQVEDVSPAQMIDVLVGDLIDHCGNLPAPILFVDGLDILGESEALGFTEVVLKPFITTRRDRTRMVIGLRDDLLLKGYVFQRRLILRLSDHAPLDVSQQFGKYPPHHFGNLDLITLQGLVPDYPWLHPFINGFLLNRAKENLGRGNGHLQIPGDLDECVKSLMARNGTFPLPSPMIFGLLKDIAVKFRGQQRWTDIELFDVFGRRLSDPLVNELFKYGVIHSEGPFFKVADGLRELLCCF